MKGGHFLKNGQRSWWAVDGGRDLPCSCSGVKHQCRSAPSSWEEDIRPLRDHSLGGGHAVRTDRLSPATLARKLGGEE